MKKGITMVSLIIYVVAFFTLTVFGTSFATNLTYKLYRQKAQVIWQEEYAKLYSNLFESSKNSNSYLATQNQINFSNQDSYQYDSSLKTLSKNGGILSHDVEELEIIYLSDEKGNTIETDKCFGIRIKFAKYGETITKEIYVTVGDEIE